MLRRKNTNVIRLIDGSTTDIQKVFNDDVMTTRASPVDWLALVLQKQNMERKSVKKLQKLNLNKTRLITANDLMSHGKFHLLTGNGSLV